MQYTKEHLDFVTVTRLERKHVLRVDARLVWACGLGVLVGEEHQQGREKYLLLSMKYEQALLLEDFTGNGAILCGFIFKI